MKEIDKFIVFVGIFIILFGIDCCFKYKKCIEKNPSIIYELYIHRLINVFVYFGWIFNNKAILTFHIILTFTLIIHWSTNNWECCLTNLENEVCEFDKNTKYDYLFQILDTNTATIITLTIKAVIMYVIFKKLKIV